ncbi:MAG: site-specific DNA-methyltransferase [Salinibacterium sp.]|nr:MAG: site-specific DNA-methyltransferase [Salinibacterium sp.]
MLRSYVGEDSPLALHEIGLEPTIDQHVETIVGVFREVRRVLRRTGVAFVNLGDTFMGSRKGPNGANGLLGGRRNCHEALKLTKVPKRASGLRKKDLVGVPWRIALALQADDWRLRCDIVWQKPTVTPESVRDRPTRDHEYVFLFSRSARYFWDWNAIAEQAVTPASKHTKHGRPINDKTRAADERVRGNARFAAATAGRVEMRNARSVWRITTVPNKEEHTASFPEALAVRCILAGCPMGGVVLDPFAGISTTGVAALKHARRYIGIELNPRDIAASRRRLFAVIEARGEATIEHARQKTGPTQLGLLAGME